MTMKLRTFAALAALALVPLADGQGPPSSVRTDSVRSERLQERRKVTGEVRSVLRARVAAEEPGRVLELTVREGRRVAAGDVLCRIDGGRLELMLAELRAEVAQGRAVIAERVADAERARRDLETLRRLFADRATNKREVDDAESDLAVAEARREQALRSVEVAEARAAILEDRLSDCVVRAPFAGQVIARETEVGEWLEVGGPVCELFATDLLEAWVLVPQRYFGAVSEDGESGLELTIDATGESLVSHEFRSLARVDSRARTFSMVVSLPSGANAAEGMSVTAWVPTGEVRDRLLVSRDAILRNEAGPYLYAVLPGEDDQPARAMLAAVELLFSVGDRVVVESPMLRPGMEVVVEGNERLFPMAPIVPIGGQGASGGGGAADGEEASR